MLDGDDQADLADRRLRTAVRAIGMVTLQLLQQHVLDAKEVLRDAEEADVTGSRSERVRRLQQSVTSLEEQAATLQQTIDRAFPQ